MGSFASTAEFYSRYREHYLPKFFKTAAEQMALCGDEVLLDVGCGPGLLAIGFAPFVGRCIGLDPEPAMIAAAKVAAEEAAAKVSFITGRFEEFQTDNSFGVVTIGRTLHWLNQSEALPLLEKIVAESGRILICGASIVEDPISPWLATYNHVRRSWASDTDQGRYQVDARAWFASSQFTEVSVISVAECRHVTIAELIGRALSRSTTSPAILGKRRAAFEADVTAALKPFVEQGVLREQIVARASVFARVR